MASFNIITQCPITTTSVVFEPGCVEDWESVLENEIDGCTFSVEVGSLTYTGSISLSSDNLMILIAFNEDSIVIPSNSCLVVDCSSSESGGGDGGDGGEETPDYCNATAVSEITDTTRLAVLDDDGCPAGFITFADLKSEILSAVKDDLNFCDFFPDGIPQGSLVVSDEILTVSGGCALKSVPTSDISCE